MINGSPDCCPELSAVYEETFEVTQNYLEWWEALDEEDERFTFGRRKFWQPLEWSKNTTYTEIHGSAKWFERTGSEMARMLKPMSMIGNDQEFLLYAKYVNDLPQKYHAVVVRIKNVERALELVPDSKAIVTQRTTVPSVEEMYVYLCEEFALAKPTLGDPEAVEEIKRLQPTVEWPFESGNSPNGYLPATTIDKVTRHVRRDIAYAKSLQQQYHNNGIVLVGPNDFLNTQNISTVYTQLDIAPPTDEWMHTWIQRFRTQAKMDDVGNPDFAQVQQKTSMLIRG